MLNADERKTLARIQTKVDQAQLRESAELTSEEDDFLDLVALKRSRQTIRKKALGGKSLTAREEKILAGGVLDSAYAKNWDDLAAAIQRSRRCITKWREKFKDAPDLPKARADGRHHIDAWKKFMAAHDLQDDNGGGEDLTDDQQPKAHWDRQKARIDYERAVYNFDAEKKKHISIAELSAALGQMLAGFRTAMNMLPGSAARWLIGLRDFHAIKAKLQSEVDGVLQALGRCRYLTTLTPDVLERLFPDRSTEYRADVAKSVEAVFQELGRLALQDLLQTDFAEVETEPSAGTACTAEATPATAEQSDPAATSAKTRTPSKKEK